VSADPQDAYVEGELDDSPTGPVSGLLRSLGSLLATIVGIAHTRVELLTTELQEEVHRVGEILIWTLIALLAAGMGLFMGALAVILVFWDTHRLLASIAMTALFFVIALVAIGVMRNKVRHKPKMLDGTLAELAKDRELLERRRRRA
jgi:uncharacterized membrane protein YqjE